MMLWDDERIAEVAGSVTAEIALRRMRDDYEQRIAELEHKIAELEREKDYYERQMPVLDRMNTENAILRDLLPDAETRAALQEAIEGFEWHLRFYPDEAERIEMMKAWLDKLESEAGKA